MFVKINDPVEWSNDVDKWINVDENILGRENLGYDNCFLVLKK